MARNFDGTNEVEISSNTDMNPTDNDLVMFIWQNCDSDISGGSGGARFSAGKGENNERHNLGVHKTDGNPTYELDNGTFNGATDTVSDARGAGWKCTAGVRDRTGTEIEIWYDGAQQATATDSGQFKNGSDTYLIGDWSYLENVGRQYKGDLAEHAYWKGTILSSSILTALDKGVNPFVVDFANLVAYNPLWGDSTEPDYAQSEGTNDTGTPTGVKASTHPNVELLENYI